MSLNLSINDNCVACMACVRACPVEAISVVSDNLEIVESTCTECGFCVPVCPHGAIDVVGDLAAVEKAVDRGNALLILPSEAIVRFYPATPEQLVNACYKAGFRAVYHELLGDELVSFEYFRLWRENENGRTWIRSTSAIAVDYIRTRHPELVPYLAPVVTPSVALARYLRHLYDDVDVVYTGVHSGGPDGTTEVTASLSFAELDRLLSSRDASPANQPLTLKTVPPERRRFLSTSGGLPLPMLDELRLSSRGFRKLRGLHTLVAVAKGLEQGESLGFIDILPFEGALDHPALGPHDELFWRRNLLELAELPRAEESVIEPEEGLDLSVSYEPVEPLPQVDGETVSAVLDSIGTAPDGGRWDCGACGHISCMAFAESVARQRASLTICPYYMIRQYERASRDAAHDALTDLYSFRALEGRLREEVARSNRTESTLAMLFLDLDGFKEANDRHGHQIGNEVLRQVAEILRSTIRSTDVAARYGGDEFVVLLVNADEEGVERVAEKIRRGVEQIVASVPGGSLGVTASIGVAYHTGSRETVLTGDDLLAEADSAVYIAKAQGGNRVHPAQKGEYAR